MPRVSVDASCDVSDVDANGDRPSGVGFRRLKVWLVGGDGAQLENMAALLRTLGALGDVRVFAAIDDLRAALADGEEPDVLVRGAQPMPMKPHDLTGRESQILALFGTGASYRNVAATLNISEGTVQTHVKRLYRKLGICSKAEAVHKAYQLQVVGEARRPQE